MSNHYSETYVAFSFSFRFITGSEINTLLNVGGKTSNNTVYREKWPESCHRTEQKTTNSRDRYVFILNKI